jgi:adenylate cyclase class IV
LSAATLAFAVASNIEIKARLSPEHAAHIRREALARSERPPQVLHQTDTFYRAPCGRLKLRRFGDGTGELIAYDRPDRAGPKHSSYVISPAGDPDSLHEALTRSLGVRGVVDKHREVILVGQTRVHLDEVTGLGRFLELEVVLDEGQSLADGEAIAAELMDAFGVEPGALVEGAYIDLLDG